MSELVLHSGAWAADSCSTVIYVLASLLADQLITATGVNAVLQCYTCDA